MVYKGFGPDRAVQVILSDLNPNIWSEVLTKLSRTNNANILKSIFFINNKNRQVNASRTPEPSGENNRGRHARVETCKYHDLTMTDDNSEGWRTNSERPT